MKSNALSKHLKWEILRYSNCWEDAETLLKALAVKPQETILGVGSAGDNCFSLLCTDPSIVVAADVNPAQLSLIELKKSVISTFDRERALAFLGFRPSTERLKEYEILRDLLSENARIFWDNNRTSIEKGIVHQGKFERYLRIFSKFILPLIHRKSSIADLLRTKNPEVQRQFYQTHWNSFSWRLFIKIFFGRRILGMGRDPQFLSQVKLNVGRYIATKTEAHLSDPQCQQNEFLHYMLRGNFGDSLPHYLRKENYSVIKQNIEKLVTFNGYAEEACKTYGQFDKMNLSNIFEYMEDECFANSSRELFKACKQGGRMVYWNLMVNRKISEKLPGHVRLMKTESEKLMETDKGFFYSSLIIEEKI